MVGKELLMNVLDNIGTFISDVSKSRVENLAVSLKPYLLSRKPKGNVIFDILPLVAETCSEKKLSVILTNGENMKRPSKAVISREGVRISVEKMDRKLADVGSDIVEYLDLEHLEKHVFSSSPDQV